MWLVATAKGPPADVYAVGSVAPSLGSIAAAWAQPMTSPSPGPELLTIEPGTADDRPTMSPASIISPAVNWSRPTGKAREGEVDSLPIATGPAGDSERPGSVCFAAAPPGPTPCATAAADA